MATYQNVDIIKKALSQALQQTTGNLTKQQLKIVISQLTIYLNNLEKFYDNLGNQCSQRMNQMEYLGASNTTVSYAMYKQLEYSKDEIQNILKQGYLLMDVLREFFTGQKITYQIGLPSKNGKQLIEFSLTMEQLLEYTRAEFNTRSKLNNMFKLRMTGKKALRTGATENKFKNIVTQSVAQGSTVYSAIWHYVNSGEVNSKNKNLGNAYEVYRVLKERHGSNSIPPPVEIWQIEQTFDEIRSNTESSLKGGDFLTQQIKYFSSAPSLTTTSLIRTTLTEIKDLLQDYIISGNSGPLGARLQDMFIKNKAVNQLAIQAENVAIDKAVDYLKNIIQNLNIQVT